jgi:gamma-glutamylcyclotransferase (GGCT)/AIG2-like uncharacterized protein YtfP
VSAAGRRRAGLHRVFSYGSLQRPDVQLRMFGRTPATYPDELVGFERSVSRGPGRHANVIRSERANSRVAGKVLELSDADLERTDEYEARDGYERIEATLASGARAWVYREGPLVRTFVAKLSNMGSLCFIPIPFDPKAVFGKVRAPVRVTLAGHGYRSTIFSMSGKVGIPLRRSHREAAGLVGNEKLEVRVELDAAPRTVTVPPDLAAAKRWQALSYSHRREHVEAITTAKKPETRARRVARALQMLAKRRP